MTSQWSSPSIDEVEDGDDVRVVEPRGEPCLALGAVEVGVAAAGAEADALERDRPAEDLVAAEPHGAHPAAPDLALERVPACDHTISPFRQVSARA